MMKERATKARMAKVKATKTRMMIGEETKEKKKESGSGKNTNDSSTREQNTFLKVQANKTRMKKARET